MISGTILGNLHVKPCCPRCHKNELDISRLEFWPSISPWSHCLRDSLKSLICFSSFSISFCLRLCSCTTDTTGYQKVQPGWLDYAALGCVQGHNPLNFASNTSPKKHTHSFEMIEIKNVMWNSAQILPLLTLSHQKNINLRFTGMKMDESWSSNNTIQSLNHLSPDGVWYAWHVADLGPSVVCKKVGMPEIPAQCSINSSQQTRP